VIYRPDGCSKLILPRLTPLQVRGVAAVRLATHRTVSVERAAGAVSNSRRRRQQLAEATGVFVAVVVEIGNDRAK